MTSSRRTLLRSAGGLAGILATARAPAFAQAAAKKMQIAAVNPVPESGAIALDWMAKALTERSKGELDVTYHGGTLLTKEIDIMNAVKAGNIAMGNPGGASATLFPEMGVFLVGYLISSYQQAYTILNGKVGDDLDTLFQQKYGVKVLFYFDYGFRHITAAQQGVIDGADLPVVNMVPLKAYEVSKYYSLTGHNYGATLIAMNLQMWNDLRPEQQKMVLDTSREAQGVVRKVTESVDTLASAKEQLESRGMIVNEPDHAPFIDITKQKLWPQYEKQYSGLWEQITAAKV
jgi:TRAP-type C4-dicarboxylate transport system substrate-binding protein